MTFAPNPMSLDAVSALTYHFIEMLNKSIKSSCFTSLYTIWEWWNYPRITWHKTDECKCFGKF